MSEEERGEGNIQLKDILRYLTAIGGPFWIFVLLLSSTVERVLYVGTDWCVAAGVVPCVGIVPCISIVPCVGVVP